METTPIINNNSPKRRVIFYIDGFNFYYGLKKMEWKKFYWLNIVSFCESFLKSNQELVCVKYFSARSLNPKQHDRQDSFFTVNKNNSKFKLVLGKYRPEIMNCAVCKKDFHHLEEKQSDVNIAVHMIKDVVSDSCDISILISADSDLQPPLIYLHELKPSHKIFVYFPPAHRNYSLQNSSDAYRYLQQFEHKFKKHLFPMEVKLSDGLKVQIPERWIDSYPKSDSK